jgi:hypothetical protein
MDIFLPCICHNTDHIVRITSFNVDETGADEDFIQIEVALNPFLGFFKRLWTGIKYILGRQCDFGHFDCILLTKEEFENMIDDYIEEVKSSLEDEEEEGKKEKKSYAN